MDRYARPTTAELLDAFSGEITDRGGEVTDTFDDGRLLFVRSVLPASADVRPGDRMRAGVAITPLARTNNAESRVRRVP